MWDWFKKWVKMHCGIMGLLRFLQHEASQPLSLRARWCESKGKSMSTATSHVLGSWLGKKRQ